MSDLNRNIGGKMENPKIMVIDDEKIVCELLERSLREKNYSIETAQDGLAAMEKIKENDVQVVITDIKMPRISGMQILKELKTFNPAVAVIMITGYPTIEYAVEATRLGAWDFIQKPFDMEKIQHVIADCVKHQLDKHEIFQQDEITQFYNIAHRMTTYSSLQDILQFILDTVLTITRAPWGRLTLQGGAMQRVNFRIEHRGTAEQNTPVNVDALSAATPPLLAQIPFYMRDDIIGRIEIYNKYTLNYFSDRERILISILMAEAGITIDSCNEFKQLACL